MVMSRTFWLMSKKTIRDYRRLLAPAMVLSLVMSAGLSSLIMSRSAFKSLLRSKELTYQNLRFADLTVPLIQMPRTALSSFKEIHEIENAQCRITVDGQVLLGLKQQNIQARFHTLPQKDIAINGLRVVEGQWPKRLSKAEALLSDAFARAWNIRTGDWVELLLKGRKIKLRVSGLVRSAEYVYQAGSATSIPEDRLFSVWWVDPILLEKLTQMQTSCNEILITLQKKANWNALKKTLEQLLRPYGYVQMIPRSQQISNYFIESELAQLKAMAVLIPFVFLAVTLFLLHITMVRVLLTQREQIGTLTAFGFSRSEILPQTLLLGVLCLLPGAVLGVLAGWWLSAEMYEIYLKFYRFAFAEFYFDIRSACLSVVLCVATGLLGSYMAVRKLLAELPATNLKPSPPSHTRATPIDSLSCFNRLGFTARMSARNLFRRPLQTGVTIVGLSLSLCLLLFARFERLAISKLIQEEFEEVQKQTHTIMLNQRYPRRVFASLQEYLPKGLLEEHLTLPILLQHGRSSREIALQLENEKQVLRSHSISEKQMRIESGLSLSRSLAESLSLKLGDEVIITTQESPPLSMQLRITQYSDNLMGYVAGISTREFLARRNEVGSTNTMLFRSSLGQDIDVKKLIHRIPAIAGIREKNFEKKVFERTVSENIGLFENFMIGFALLIAAGVLYNNARIQFAERQAELSLLRAIGFLEGELTLVFWSDYIILLFISFFPGLILGRWFIHWVMQGIETEMFRIPVYLNWTSYAWACFFLIFCVGLAGILIQSKIRNIPFITVLKTRE